MTIDIQKISTEIENTQEQQLQIALKMLFQDNYTERTHFIFELLQNAEDALERRSSQWTGSRTIKFGLINDKLIVSHFGDPFNNKDVLGICSIGQSTKDSERNIGRFGIGFKSVYVYTDRPEIHSGPENSATSFAIYNYNKPTNVQPLARDADETIFVFPFKPGEEEKSYKEIASGLKNLGALALLFLHQIEEIQWTIGDDLSGNYLRETEHINEFTRRVTVIGQSSKTKAIHEKWLIFSKPIRNDNSSESNLSIGSKVEIAFSVIPDTQTIQPLKKSPLVVFFPTVYHTGLGFLVQGPYKTTPNREAIHENDPFNEYLVDETAVLLRHALLFMRDENILDANALGCLPLELQQITEMFEPIFHSTKDTLNMKALLPKLDGGYVSAREALLGRSQDFRMLLTSEQLSMIYNTNKQLAWLSSDITVAGSTHGVYNYLLKELDVKLVTPKNIVQRLSKAFLQNQTDEWIIELYVFLSSRLKSLKPVIMNKSIIRLEDGTHLPPSEEEIFLPGEDKTDFRTIRRNICNSDTIDFFKSLGFRTPDLVDDVIIHVLPKYREENLPGLELIETDYKNDIKRIIRAYDTDSIKQQQKLVEELKQTAFVVAYEVCTKSMKFSEPEHLYLATERLKTIFKELKIKGAFIVDDDNPVYQNIATEEIFKKCGIISHLRALPKRLTRDKMQRLLEDNNETTSGYNDHGIDWEIDSFSEVLSRITKLDYEQQEIISKLLWEELIYLRKMCSVEIFTSEYTWTYYGSYSLPFDTIFVEQLNNTKWIPHEGELKFPASILFDDLGWEQDDFLLTKIKFKPSAVVQLAEEMGLEVALLDKLKELNITKESDLIGLLADKIDETTESGKMYDDLPSTESNNQGPFAECLLERMTFDSSDEVAKPVIISTGGPTTRESAVNDTKLSGHFGRSGRRVRKEVHQFELTEDAKTLRSRFRDMVLNDYQGRCQICGNLFETREGKSKRHQIFIFHIVPPSRDRRTNHFGNLLGLCGWHYALVSYGQWSIIEKQTGNPIKGSEQLVHMLTSMDEVIDDDGNSYIAVPVSFYKVYRQWESNSETINEIIHYSRPHWDYLCELLKDEEQSDD